ncbi:hypothetical protein GGF32_002679 [Allomyces javanicus]|nr:hypothetical protein GGF32_002679 [Allomyces javanicus]
MYYNSDDDYRVMRRGNGAPSLDGADEQSDHANDDSDRHSNDDILVPSLTRLGKLIAWYSDACSAPFTVDGAASQLPDAPGLEIDGIGLVPIPVVDDAQAAKLVSVAHEAPFGRGFETLDDPAVRKTWEIDPTKIRFTNPDWAAGIMALTMEIAAKLDHGRMLAEVVIQLPSRHEGGELVVYGHDTDQDVGASPTAITHDFGRTPNGMGEFQSHYVVHYADAEHELKPVTSGYRLALISSLCWPAEQPMLVFPHQIQARIAWQLASLAHAGRVYCYFFDHDDIQLRQHRFQ